MMRLSIKDRRSINEVIIPFFERYPLKTSKADDFELFRRGMAIINSGEHLSPSGLRKVAELTELMNRRQRSRYLKSSEAIRQPPR